VGKSAKSVSVTWIGSDETGVRVEWPLEHSRVWPGNANALEVSCKIIVRYVSRVSDEGIENAAGYGNDTISMVLYTSRNVKSCERHEDKRLTNGYWIEGKAHDGGQRGEYHFAVDLLLEAGSQLYLDAVSGVSSIPVTLHGCGFVESWPGQVAGGGVANAISGCAGRCHMSVDLNGRVANPTGNSQMACGHEQACG
jgi:hypothetical protein